MLDSTRKNRLEELRRMFNVTVLDGKAPPHGVVAETIAMYLNRKHGRQVVVPRERQGSPEGLGRTIMCLACVLTALPVLAAGMNFGK